MENDYLNQNSNNNNSQISNNMQTKNDMLNQIKALNFSIIEISLYLNTHPNDVRALNIHRRYCNELHNLKDKYQKMYGPLSIYCPCNKWRWLEEPWPWEGGMN